MSRVSSFSAIIFSNVSEPEQCEACRWTPQTHQQRAAGYIAFGGAPDGVQQGSGAAAAAAAAAA